MNYNKLINILLSDDVYNEMKKHEKDILILIPELSNCIDFNQNNKWHIYDVYEHILHVIKNVESNKILRITALFHDIGKPLTYTEDNEKIGHFYNHWIKSIEIFSKYKNKLNLEPNEAYIIKFLIFYHDLNIEKLNHDELKTIINNLGFYNIKLLFKLKRADLLAQNREYHYLLENLNIQEQKILEFKKT